MHPLFLNPSGVTDTKIFHIIAYAPLFVNHSGVADIEIFRITAYAHYNTK